LVINIIHYVYSSADFAKFGYEYPTLTEVEILRQQSEGLQKSLKKEAKVISLLFKDMAMQ